MADLTALLEDLAAEGEELDHLVAPLTVEQWLTLTPADGWTVVTQIAHLVWTDEVAILAATDEAGFARQLDAAFANVEGFVDDAAAEIARSEPAALLDRWRLGRAELLAALAAVPSGHKLPWFGPPMSAASMATARLMETWAHGQDVADALGVERVPTARLRNIAHIGVRTRDFAFVANELEPPADPFLVELAGPDGGVWSWGPDGRRTGRPRPGGGLRVAGHPAASPGRPGTRCRGRRRRRGGSAIAQAFAGPPGSGRSPGQFGTSSRVDP